MIHLNYLLLSILQGSPLLSQQGLLEIFYFFQNCIFRCDSISRLEVKCAKYQFQIRLCLVVEAPVQKETKVMETILGLMLKVRFIL